MVVKQFMVMPVGVRREGEIQRQQQPLAGLAGRDSSDVSAAEAASEAETAMALLHKAVALGYRSLEGFRTEDVLDPLRGRAAFLLLMMDLAMPDDPFARPD